MHILVNKLAVKFDIIGTFSIILWPMQYKSLFNFTNDKYFFDLINLSKKVTFDGKTKIQYKDLNFFPNLDNTLNNIISFEETDLFDALSSLGHFCYLDDFRPDPNQLLYQTPIFDSLCKIIFNSDQNILFLCLQILVHLSLADYSLDCPMMNPDFLQGIVNFLEPCFDIQIHYAILDFLLNITLNENLTLDIFNQKIIDQLSSICLATNSSKVLIIIYRIGANFAHLIYENDQTGYFVFFDKMIQILISSLKPSTPQPFAIELLSYLLYNFDCCQTALNFNIIDKLKELVKTLTSESIQYTFISINSLIENCNLIDQFTDDFIIKKVMSLIREFDKDNVHPLFVYIDLLCKNHVDLLEKCGTIKFLCDLTYTSPLYIKKKAVFILARLIDQCWMIMPRPSWVDLAISLVIHNIDSISMKKIEVVLLTLIEIHDFNEHYFFETLSNTDILDRLEDLCEMEGVSEKVIDYTNYLTQLILKK